MTRTSPHYHGPLPADIWLVLHLAWEIGMATQGDWARKFHTEVALGASLGWLSNVTPEGDQYTNRWRTTVAGLTVLQNKELYTP